MPLSEKELQSLSLLSERASHALRTPLSTCLGALEELLSGYSLEKDELSDARDAAKKMVDTLDFLRQLSMSWGEAREVALSQYLSEAGFADREEVSPTTTIFIPEVYGSRILNRLSAYLVPKELKLDHAEYRFITLRITSSRKMAGPCASVEDALRYDQRLDAFILVFAEAFFRATGGSFSVGTDDELNLLVSIGLVACA